MRILLFILCLPFIGFSQMPYAWSGNPLWTASNPTIYTLNWQSTIGNVSSNGANVPYNNGQNTTYTSGAFNFTSLCPSSSMINVQTSVSGELENGYDYLRFEYSSNGGSTWNTLGTFTGVFNSTPSYNILSGVNIMFRFRFTSDGSVNSYCANYHWFWGCLQTNYYYVDITTFSVSCIVVLNSYIFSGYKDKNEVVHFNWDVPNTVVQKSFDGHLWENIDGKYEKLSKTTYFRLSTNEFNDKVLLFHTDKLKVVVRIYDVLGREIDDPNKGELVIVEYADGTFKKVIYE